MCKDGLVYFITIAKVPIYVSASMDTRTQSAAAQQRRAVWWGDKL